MIKADGRDTCTPTPPKWRPGLLFPANGRSRCYRCRRPFERTAGVRAVEYERPAPSRSAAQFALCKGCWDRSTLDERLAAHHWTVVWYWSPEGVSDHLLAILDGVRRDSAELGDPND